MLFIVLSAPVFIAFGILIVVAAYFTCMEGYNPFAPYADTRFAPGYTAEKFAAVKPRMTTEQVKQLLGEPLITDTALNGRTFSFWYSDDGGLYHGNKGKYALIRDFAWYSTMVLFDSKGRVTEVYKSWEYD